MVAGHPPTGAAPEAGGVPGPLCRRVRAIAGAAAAELPPGPLLSEIHSVLDRLAEPGLRIAVGGRMKAGKSTLINALVGQEVAATAATECTLLVAWFRAGPQNRVVVHSTDGRRVETGARPGGGIPYELSGLGVPLEEIQELEVELANRRLAEYTIVDTPGVDSLSGLDDVAMAALARADALLYVMPHPGQGEQEALEALRRKASGSITAATVLGVLSRIDELGSGTGDPWPHARRIAGRYSRSLTGLVGTIVPVVGLLAQAAAGDGYTDDDTARIARLAATTEADLTEALYSGDAFLAWDAGPLPAGDRRRLLGLLGRHGIAEAFAAWHSGTRGSAAMLSHLRAASGIDELESEIRGRFVASADRLRAARAIHSLDQAAGGAGGDDRVLVALRAGLAEVRTHPLMRQAELGTALADLASGTLTLPEPDGRELVALATGGSPAACLGLPAGTDRPTQAREADRLAARWRVIENTARQRVTRRHARAARELYEALYFLD
ncbi:50S ribosome-binding GTPase [Phytohabitans flavus]|uniref:GTPase n=1 Tax=Phytohabitans flavus TaxID=1076124 RepID=A0A6F8Y665_9ACTN|nr:GTPase [Phytohabitans flavus]